MNASVTVGLLHPGRMGAAIAAQVVTNGHTVLWCPDGRSEATHHRAKDARLHPAVLGKLLADSEIILSICPPAVAEDIATDVAEVGYNGVYVDANAISPARMHRITTRLTEAGAAVIDGCISGPPPGGHPAARLYLAGAGSARRRVADLFTSTLVEPVHLGDQLGQASALKMAFACYQKASRTLAALADDLDVTEALLAEAERMPRDTSLTATTYPASPPEPGAGHQNCARSPTPSAPNTSPPTSPSPPPTSFSAGPTPPPTKPRTRPPSYSSCTHTLRPSHEI